MSFLFNLKYLFNGVDVDNLINKIDSLKKELSSAKKLLSENSRLLAEKNKEVASLKQLNETMAEDVVREKNMNTILDGKIADLNQSIAELMREKVILYSSEQKLKDECEKATKSNASLNAKNLALTSKASELEEKNKQLESIHTRLQSEISERDSTISTFRTNYNNLLSEYNNKEGELEEVNKIKEFKKVEKEGLRENINKLQERNHVLSEKLDLLQVAVDKLTSENSRLKEDSAKIKKDVDLLTEENSGKKRECSSLNEELNQQKIENKSLQQQIKELLAEKEELTPYLYLIETKKEQEALDAAVLEAKKKLQDTLDSSTCVLASITHEEVKEVLEKAIKSSQELINSVDSTLEELNDSKESIDSATNKAEEQERDLVEQEEIERKRNEEETVTIKAKEDSMVRVEEETQIQNEESKYVNDVFDSSTETAYELMDDNEAFEDDTLPYIYDNELIPAEKLSIPKVYDIKEEKIIDSKDFFSQDENDLILWRRNLQEEYLMGHARFICPECKQPVKISGHKLLRGRVCYFAHFKDSYECPYKTGTNRTKEEIEKQKYSLVQESERHKQLKALIESALKGEKSKAIGVENVECEKRINSDIPYLKWRRPDIYAEYNGRKFVFEIQLSTTFISVIVDRDIFYRLNDYNIIWIFNFEDNTEYVNLQNLMFKDIYYSNKRNVFIFDTDAADKSKEVGELVLKCRWLDENGSWSLDKYVTLEMLQYDEEYNKPFIFDADKAYLEKHPECIEKRKQFEFSREYLLKALMERQKYEENIEKRREEERVNLQAELLNTNRCVQRFRNGTKYGYQYNGTSILPAKYTKAEDIGENGYAQVGFNRKIGLVRKDGKEIVPVEYRNIDVINSHHGIVIAQYKRVDLWLGDERFTLINEFNEKEQTIIKENENGETKYILQTNTYDYTYSQSYYRDHPICHKSFKGYSKSTLFTILEENDYCIVMVDQAIYSLSKNRLSRIDGTYSNIIPIGINHLYIVKDYNTDLWGVIDFQGNIVTAFKYAKLIPTESEFLIAKYTNESSVYGVIDYQGREFIKPQHEVLIYLNSERFAFRKEGLWGLCDIMGSIMHEAEYTYIKSTKSGELRASTLESYLAKWNVVDNKPSYYDDNIKLCLLNDIGTITYTEENNGRYKIRHSGDLYSILSIDDKELVKYNLSYVNFVTETIAIIKNTEDEMGFFIDEKCLYLDDCKNIEHLIDGFFKFENNHETFAFGDCSGPITEYSYANIRTIDTSHFIASRKHLWGNRSSGNDVVIDNRGVEISVSFDSIDDFKDGYANAVYKGREGIINAAGVMQENIVNNYGDFMLCEKFENYYFRNKDAEIVSDEYQNIELLIDKFFIVRKREETNFRLFSIELKKATDDSFSKITNLVDNIFVAQTLSYSYDNSFNKYLLYKGLEKVSSDLYSSIILLDNDYIALQKTILKEGIIKNTWKLSKKDGIYLNNSEYDSIPEVNKDSFKVYIDGHEGLIDLEGHPIIEKKSWKNNYILTHCFADYGLEDSEGNVILSLDDHISSIVLTEDSLMIVCKENKYALYTTEGIQITEHKFLSIVYETNNRYAVVEDGVKGHIDALGNYIESTAVSITDDGISIFIKMEKYGLRGTEGDIIIPSKYTHISYLTRRLLVVRKGAFVALSNLEGAFLTKFKYSDIICREDGAIIATRNETTGGLDDQGKEIFEKIQFNGGYIQSLYGSYCVINEAEETIIPTGYSKIEILDNDGIFALWKGTKVAIGNISNEKTEPIYESVKPIGNGFYIVSRTISRNIRTRHTGYGHKGNPYTYFSFDPIDEKKYGIIDGRIKVVIPCKYKTISDFDGEQNLTITKTNGEKNTISLQKLKKKASHILSLSVGTEYNAKVQSFMSIGLIIKIQGCSFIIHKKYLFKEKKMFKKGELIIVKFLGYDQNVHPLWETRTSSN